MSWHWSKNGHRSLGLELSKVSGDRMQVVDDDDGGGVRAV